MKDFTVIPNLLLRPSKLKINARYLLCVLLRYCRNLEYCFPSQRTLGKDLELSARQVSVYLNELIKEGLISKTRTGFNTSNTYKIDKNSIFDTEPVSTANEPTTKIDRKQGSAHIRSVVPFYTGNILLPSNTSLLIKDNNTYSGDGLEKLRKSLIARGLKYEQQNVLGKNNSKNQVDNLFELFRQKTKTAPFKAKTANTIEPHSEKENLTPDRSTPPMISKTVVPKTPHLLDTQTSKFSPSSFSKIDSRHAVKKYVQT